MVISEKSLTIYVTCTLRNVSTIIIIFLKGEGKVEFGEKIRQIFLISTAAPPPGPHFFVCVGNNKYCWRYNFVY